MYKETLSWKADSIIDGSLALFRYDKEGFTGWHCDQSLVLNEDEHVTFLLYLNDDFQGEQTCFKDGDVKPKKGLALFFPTSCLHKGERVTQGSKYILRAFLKLRAIEST